MHTQPIDNIDAVLGRFQAWTGSASSQKMNTPNAGIRELSYEEALQSSRYRRPPDRTSAGKNSEGKSVVDEAGIPPVIKSEPAATNNRPKRRTETKKRSKSHTAKPLLSAVAASKKPRAEKKVVALAPAVKADFRDVLAETIMPAKLIVPSAPSTELARQINLTVRLTPAERDLIKARAAESGIAASAYIRQCALEVEQLRAQVQQKLAAMDNAIPICIPSQGFFTRVTRRFFPKHSSALALRA